MESNESHFRLGRRGTPSLEGVSKTMECLFVDCGTRGTRHIDRGWSRSLLELRLTEVEELHRAKAKALPRAGRGTVGLAELGAPSRLASRGTFGLPRALLADALLAWLRGSLEDEVNQPLRFRFCSNI